MKKRDPVTQEEIFTANQKLFRPIRIGNPFLTPKWYTEAVTLFKSNFAIASELKKEDIINEKETEGPKPSEEQIQEVFTNGYFNFELNPERFVDYMNRSSIKHLIPSIAVFDHISYGYWNMQKQFKHLRERIILPLPFWFFANCDAKERNSRDMAGTLFLNSLKVLKDVEYVMFIIPDVGNKLEEAASSEAIDEILVSSFKKTTQMVGVIFDFESFVKDNGNRRYFIVDFQNNQIGKKIREKSPNEFAQYVEHVLNRALLVFMKAIHPKTRHVAQVCQEFDIKDAYVLVREVGNEYIPGSGDVVFTQSKTINFYRALNYYFEIIRTIAFNPFPSLIIREEKPKKTDTEADEVVKEIKEERKDIVFMIRFTEQTCKDRHVEYIETILKSQYDQTN